MESKLLLPMVVCDHLDQCESVQGSILPSGLEPDPNIVEVGIISDFLLAKCTKVIGRVCMALDSHCSSRLF